MARAATFCRPGRRGVGRCQRGSGTILLAATVLVLAVIAGALTVVATYIAAAHAVRGAADLTAVSAAADQVRGQDACATARRIAGANGVHLVACRVIGDSFDFVVTVAVERTVRGWLPSLPGAIRATAHAGRVGMVGG